MPLGEHGYSWRHRSMEIFGIIAFAVMGTLLGMLVSEGVVGPTSWWILLGAAVAGFIGADFVSGVVHWLCDRYGSVDTFLVGSIFIREFRDHHTDPKGITRHDLIETNGDNCLFSLPLMLFVYFLVPHPASGPVALFVHASFFALVMAILGTNQFHKWAHQEVAPWYARILQRCRLILSPGHHDRHYTVPFDTHYCITTGWLNGPLHAIRFWTTLEWIIAKVTRIRAGGEPKSSELASE